MSKRQIMAVSVFSVSDGPFNQIKGFAAWIVQGSDGSNQLICTCTTPGWENDQRVHSAVKYVGYMAFYLHWAIWNLPLACPKFNLHAMENWLYTKFSPHLVYNWQNCTQIWFQQPINWKHVKRTSRWQIPDGAVPRGNFKHWSQCLGKTGPEYN